jgi:hypothetical protein
MMTVGGCSEQLLKKTQAIGQELKKDRPYHKCDITFVKQLRISERTDVTVVNSN